MKRVIGNMGKKPGLKYRTPDDWFRYDARAVMRRIIEAEAAVQTYVSTPFRWHWVSKAQVTELDAEARATWRISSLQGSRDMSAPERDAAARARDTYQWIFSLPQNTRISKSLISEIHRRIEGLPGAAGLRRKGEQVLHGVPLQRGARGGRECREALDELVRMFAAADSHPPSVRALALHYHFTAIHPYLSGNGPTARALEALMHHFMGLTGLRFLGMANFYLDEHEAYFAAISAAQSREHDLTPFLDFALQGFARACARRDADLQHQIRITLFRSTMLELFGEIRAGKRQAMADRQVGLLDFLLRGSEGGAEGSVLTDAYNELRDRYERLRNPWKAFLRDTEDLIQLGTIELTNSPEPKLLLRLAWPAEITETRFVQHFTENPRVGLTLSM